MALTENQVNDYVQKAAGRPATDYEVKTFSTASPQTLAGLPEYYKGLNTDNSITDYLKSKGIDPNTRTDLAKAYGLDNSATGNTTLLSNLKKGVGPTTTPVQGTIAPQQNTQTTNPTSTPTAQTPEQIAETNANIAQGQKVAGSIASAVTSPATSTDTNEPPLVSDTTASLKDQYTNVQKQVMDIDNQLSSMLDNKIQEVARSGGFVDKAALQSQILAEQAPLLEQRKVLASQQSQLGSQLSSAQKLDQQARADYFKQQTINQGQEKVSQGQEKIDVQKQQFTQKEQDTAVKLQQSGYKLASATDEFGNKTSYWTKNPGSNSGFNTNGQPVALSTDTQGNTTATPKPTPTNGDTSNPNGISVAQYGLLANVKDFNPDKPMDKDAYVYLTNYLTGTGTTNAQGGKTLQLKSDIQNRAATLYQEATGKKLPTAQTVKTTNSLLGTNSELLNNLDVQTGTIKQNFGLDLANLTANNINTSGPIINNLLNYIANANGSPSVAQYLSQNETLQNELASLLSVKNASGTTVADKLSSSDVLPQGASIDQAKTILSTLMKEADNQSNTILNTNAKLYIKVDGLGLNPQNPVNNTIVMQDSSGNTYQFDPNSMTPQQLNDAFNSGYTLISQQ